MVGSESRRTPIVSSSFKSFEASAKSRSSIATPIATLYATCWSSTGMVAIAGASAPKPSRASLHLPCRAKAMARHSGASN